ncbi:hypothetical protein GCM10008018_37010 [Paenibacillus marchantiophytorum]|uniref:Tyrosine-type recombinase/integrase n=1 Tax=Paenibacillus marchantiophytorum TaxID=1619310 RepID=A0ABQ1EVH6_9BACL|nr:tyrosine-type recombinase/integrase [Paenibacillus marchantiophytorum]GFZ87358.1 hypothetical protein GCM10008018_37010 [Paenibacillus marchantiophytorum]
MDSDSWVLKANEDLPDYVFNFDFLPNGWIKDEVKRYTRDSLEIGNLKVSTLHRYNYSLRHFFNYLDENEIIMETFADITPRIVEKFIFFLLMEVEKPSTRAVILSALKHLINYGQVFELKGYPQVQLFDRTEFRMLQTEDTLKSMIIPDQVMEQIKGGIEQLLQENDYELVLLACLLTICMYTGVRISEALMLKENSISKDFFGKPLLEVISEKNETERYIAVRKEVVDVIERLKDHTSVYREELKTDRLFVRPLQRRKRTDHLQQYYARTWLKNKFVKKFNICHMHGELYDLHYHQFRHTLATDMLANGMSPFEIKEYLGHESLHSTRLYAKVRNNKLIQSYKKLGFIGMIVDKVELVSGEKDIKLDTKTRLMAQLPDGVCARPIKEKVVNCKQPNACLFCPKFVTTPEFIEIHQDHLRRIREDKSKYKEDHFIGTDYLINETEEALVDIISRLERLVGIDE